jgi:pyruvate dehydrogenase E1 component alpha subunit
MSRCRVYVLVGRDHRDPIVHAEKELEKLGVKADELKAIDKQIKDIIVEAAKFAEDAPEPAPEELYTDVLVESY